MEVLREEGGTSSIFSLNSWVVRVLAQKGGNLGSRPPSPSGDLNLSLSDFLTTLGIIQSPLLHSWNLSHYPRKLWIGEVSVPLGHLCFTWGPSYPGQHQFHWAPQPLTFSSGPTYLPLGCRGNWVQKEYWRGD